jgi:hypothetical protein
MERWRKQQENPVVTIVHETEALHRHLIPRPQLFLSTSLLLFVGHIRFGTKVQSINNCHPGLQEDPSYDAEDPAKENLLADARHIFVTKVAEAGFSGRAGLLPGDVIVGVIDLFGALANVKGLGIDRV